MKSIIFFKKGQVIKKTWKKRQCCQRKKTNDKNKQGNAPNKGKLKKLLLKNINVKNRKYFPNLALPHLFNIIYKFPAFCILKSIRFPKTSTARPIGLIARFLFKLHLNRFSAMSKNLQN